jgi:hypothetical protein
MTMALWFLVGCRPPDVEAVLSSWSEPPEGMDTDVWQDAQRAWSCGVAGGHSWSAVLGVADFSLPSDERRLWVVDLQTHEVLVHDRVAHGSGSGERQARVFSDAAGSHATSLGLYRGRWPYHGKHGRSLRLDGLEASNRSARARAVVVHPSRYMDDDWVAEHGAPGRSWGCFAVDPDLSDRVVDALRGGLLLSWADQDEWREHSPFLRGCD